MYVYACTYASTPSDRRNSRGKALAERDSVARYRFTSKVRFSTQYRCNAIYTPRRIDRRTDKSIDRDRSHAICRFDLTDRNVRSCRSVTRRYDASQAFVFYERTFPSAHTPRALRRG